MSDLTPKQQRFVEEYLVDRTATAAARRAGYSEKTAEQQGSRLLRNVKVAAEIERQRSEQTRRVNVTADRVLQELARLSYADPRRLFNADGSLKPIHELDDEAAACISAIEFGRDGIKKVRMWDKGGALSILAKHLGLTIERSLNIDLSNLNDEEVARLANGEDVLAVLAGRSKG